METFGLILYKLFVLFTLSTLCKGVISASSCSTDKSDPHRCDKVVDNGIKCVIFRRPSTNCSNNVLVCMESRKVCFQMDRICTPQCCDHWKEDADGRCSIDTRSRFEKPHNSKNVSTVISGLVVGILFIVLIVMSFAMCRICRARHNLLQRRHHSSERPHQNLNSSVFTVFNNEPPPYEVAVSSKLPEYSPRNNPPDYQENEHSGGIDNLAINIHTDLGAHCNVSISTTDSGDSSDAHQSKAT